MFALLLTILVIIELVLSSPLPQADDEAEGRSFIGFSFFAPPARVEPHQCVATNGLLTIGTCYNKQSCIEAGGVDSGTCTTGGVCCVIPSVCGGTIARNLTWFVNKDFPERTRDAGDCTVTLRKEFPRVKQARLDFQLLQLEGPYQGRCSKDSFVVTKVHNVNGRDKEEELVPKLCGDNSNQHVYVDMEQDEVQIKVKLDSGSVSRGASSGREWRVLVTQLDDKDIAPPKCLQYHREGKSEVRSLNYGATDDFKDDLNYDICFKKLSRDDKVEESCTRKFSKVNIDQTKSYREQNSVRRRKMKKNKNHRSNRSVASRELPAQSLPSNEVDEAFSDVISLVSRTVEKVINETDLKKGVEDIQNTLSTTAEQFTETTATYTSEDNGDTTTLKYETNDQILADSVKNNNNLAVDTPGVFPLFYSAGDEEVISQIQRVVLQLQQEQLGIGGLGVNPGDFGFGSQTEAKVLQDTTTDILTSEVTEATEIPDYSPVTNPADVGVSVNDADDTDKDQIINLDEDSKGIEDSVSTISNIVSDLLSEYSTTTVDVPEEIADNVAVEDSLSETLSAPETSEEVDKELEIGTTDSPSELVTDNLAVEGSVMETIITLEGIKVENDKAELAITSEDTGGVNTGIEIENDGTIMLNANESGTDNNHATENQEVVVVIPHTVEMELNEDFLVTQIYATTIPSEMNTPEASDTSIESVGIDGESDNAHAEITVLDPESVQVHGDLVIKNQPNDDYSSTTKSLIENIDEAIVYVEVTPSTSEADYITVTTNGILDVKEPVSNDESVAIPSEINNEDVSSAEISSDDLKNTEKQSENEIQWLILEGDSAGNKETEEPALAIPPEVIISSDIGFGSNSNSIKNEVSNTNSDNSENTEDNVTETNDRNVSDAPEDLNLNSLQDLPNSNEGINETTESTSEPVNLYQAHPQVPDEEDTQEDTGNTGSLNIIPENATEIHFATDESKNNEVENTSSEAPVEDFNMPEKNKDTNESEDVTGISSSNDTTNNEVAAESDILEDNSPTDEAVINNSKDDIEETSNDDIDITIHDTSFDSTENDNTKDESDSNIEEEPTLVPEAVFTSDEEQCGGSFLKVQEKVICGVELRQEALEGVSDEDERFRDVERISVRSMEDASQSLRFELRYETQCPESKDEPTTPAPVRKTVTLLQYLLGWYR